MTKFEKNYKLLTNRQQIDNIFLCIYINNFVKLFRYYNNDKFLITISGLKNFINEDEEDIIYLLKQLEENDFTIKFEGNDESISILEIICENISNDTTYSYKYDIQDLPSIIELSSKTNIPAVGIIIMKVVARIIIKLKTLYKAIVLDLDDTLCFRPKEKESLGIDKYNYCEPIQEMIDSFESGKKTSATKLSSSIKK